ncbi:MAG: fimbrial biogenesis outer membrane usher protein [Sphingomonas sp.]|nr:fimbrial biogenesis outer membrane usher protein [Sphingomonas sp.]
MTVDADPTDVPFVALVPPPREAMFLSATINGTPDETSRLFLRRGDRFWARSTDLDAWGIAWTDTSAETIDGDRFVPLDDLPGLEARIDAQNQAIDLRFAARAFRPTRLEVGSEPIRPTDGTFAAFLNYDVAITRDRETQAAAYVEAGVSDDWGLASTTLSVTPFQGRTRAVRLDSYILRDDPESMTRLMVGDTVTAPSTWAGQVRYGGVRFGSQFSLQPDFISFPTPVIAGSAAVPSQVDILVNSALLYRGELNRGPFSFDNLPLVSGSGEVELHVRDMLGVDHALRTNYYVSRALLRPGLADWSIEAGALRHAYGLQSFTYGAGFLAGSYRRGITRWLSLGTRSYLSSDTQLAGGDVSLVLAPFGELSLASAITTGRQGTGWRYRAEARRIARDWSLAVSLERSSPDFEEPGTLRYQAPVTRELQMTAGLDLGTAGSLGLSYTDLVRADGTQARVASANYNVALGPLGYASLFALATDDSRRSDVIAGLGITIPLGRRASGYAQADNRGVRAEARLAPPTDRGLGYRLAIERGPIDREQGELLLRDESGDYVVQASRTDGRLAGRFLANGGLVLTGGQLRLRRRVGEAIALVSVPGQANVRIYSENRLVARTDSDGTAVIPGLIPYVNNHLSISAEDLPMNVTLDRTAMTVVPRERGAAAARFDTRQARPATIIILMPDGTPLMPGTRVTSGDSESAYFSGYDSEVFVPDLTGLDRLSAQTPSGACSVRPVIATTDTLPVLGPYRCTLSRETRHAL